MMKMRKMRKNNQIVLPTLALLLLLGSCSVAQYIPEGELYYTGVKKIAFEDKGGEGTVNNRLARKDMAEILNYKPNNSLFGSASLRLPFTYPFYINKHYAKSNNFFGRWLYKTFAQEPILISEVNPTLRASVAEQVLREYGYFRSRVTPEVEVSKDSISAKTIYTVFMGEPHLLDSINYNLSNIPLENLEELYSPKVSLLKNGQPFGVLPLENERTRISDQLRSKGYYYFQPNHIVYEADTVQVPNKVQLRVRLSDKMLPEAYKPWRIGSITYNIRDGVNSPLTDSLMLEGVLYRYNKKSPVRLSVLRPRIRIAIDSLYSQEAQLNTLRSMAELNTFAYTDVSFSPDSRRDSITNRLNVVINSQLDRPYTTELEGVFRFKSNNQVGPGLNFSVNRKNVFRAGELLTVTARGSYEWETKRTTQGSNWDINSYELGLTTALTFPRILFPILGRNLPTYPSSTKISLNGTFLNRGRFYKQAQFGGDISYHLQPSPSIRHTITPLSISYNHLISKTEKFEEAIVNNPILGLSFRNQFIPQANYLFGWELQNPISKHGFSLQAYVAEAGNLLSLFYKGAKQTNGEPHQVLGAPFAQFVKGTLELRYNYRFNTRLQFASRAYAGAVYSYGNMDVAPYTEQFYSGGANSIRGFNVRALGPGGYTPLVEDPLSFMDRTGDIRFEANLELRYRAVGALELATFIDAGNVWLIRPDSNRPGGELSGKYLLNDIALGTGLGVRYDLEFLVLRLDVGLGLHNPTRSGGKYINTFDKRIPLAFHLAIGYPF